ncbi:hypothetical protein F8M41_014991 [Gigaspora margarita]|uniref:Uncharacterized protein n=1 Tax=Gigaspora margarita TaxID=4874 RepID=A0A8H3WVX7_GIGMA|nr:hypothetical protein F8M41_014991 [Gigaspora margarita]
MLILPCGDLHSDTEYACSEEPFNIRHKQLETIVVKGKRHESEKARLLINKYSMDPKPDFKKAIRWDQERVRQIHINKATITKIDNKFNHGNINVGPIETEQPKETRSKNREINQLDFTTLNTITAAEHIGNVDEEQGKTFDLEKSWEFERPIPEWLKRIHKHREGLVAKVDTTDLESYSRVAETTIWWRIIDACDPKLTEIITEQEFTSLKETLLSDLPSDWKVLEPPVERCLRSIAMLDENGLKKVAKITVYYGICGAIKKIRKILATSIKIEEDNPFLVSSATEITATEITTSNDIIKDEDAYHPDVRYIIELLRYTYDMIDKKIPQRENSERDVDVRRDCFQSSRQRRILAIGASDKAEGYHADWLFTKHDLAKDLTWGQEFSLCERAGSKIENGRKILDNTLKVQKTLRDMHQTLMEAVSQAGCGTVPVKVLKAFQKLILPGFISSRFFIRVLLNVYIGSKYYGSIVLAEFDIPTQFDELGKIATIARVILNVKNIFKQTIRTFTLMKEASEKNKHSKENVVIPQRIKENMTPKTKRTKRALEPSNANNMTPKTKRTKRALEPSNANNTTPKTKRTKRALEPSNVNNTQ